MRFSIYGAIPNTDVIAKEYAEQKLKRIYNPKLKRELKPGWLMPYLYHIDSMLWRRWEYWQRLQLVPQDKFHLLQEPDTDKRLKNIREHILPKEPIPQITFGEGYVSHHDKGREMLDICLEKMLTKGGYVNIMSRIEYLLDWLLYGFGHPHPWFRQLPSEPHSCDGSSMILYQLFDLFYLLYKPKDYWGVLIAEGKGKGSQKHTGYFPTPGSVTNMMGMMLMDHQKDARLEIGCEPAIGTGVMTLEASNHLLSMVGIDIDKILLKACLVNWYLYCPWLAVPVYYLAERTDLLWGNALVEADHPQAPQSIHQKYWLKEYQEIYPVNLVKRDWQTEIKEIIANIPADVKAPGISKTQALGDPESTKVQSRKYKRPKAKKKFKKGLLS